MSAWMTSDIHRSALVQEAVVRGVIWPEQADELWQRMTFDNLWALHCRYGDPMPVDNSEDLEVKRTHVEHPLDPWVLLKSISCWNYQCAAFDQWDQTTAHRYIDQLRELLMAELGVDDETYYAHPFWSKCDVWGIDRWEQVMACTPSSRN